MTKAHTEPGFTPRANIAGEPDLAFAATLASRLCHDLSGTMGALTGMLDMAVEGGEPEALELALTCARELSGRLRLLRAAWSNDSDVPELSSVLAGVPGAERLSVQLPPPSALDDAARRLAANLLLVAAAALPRGGTIRLTAGGGSFSMEIEGPRAAWPAALEQCLADPRALRTACTRPREVGVAVACLVAGETGLTLTVHGPTRLTAGQ